MEVLNHFFDSMEAQGVDTNQPLLYGYFFFDKDLATLQPLRDELIKQKYIVVRLEKMKMGIRYFMSKKSRYIQATRFMKEKANFMRSQNASQWKPTMDLMSDALIRPNLWLVMNHFENS
jgi:hypothetical protein